MEQLIFDFPFDSTSKNRILDKLFSTSELDPSQTIRFKALKLICRFATHNNILSTRFFHVLIGRCSDKDKRIRALCFQELKKNVKLILSKKECVLEKSLIAAIDTAIRSHDTSVLTSVKQLLMEIFSQQEPSLFHWIQLLFNQFDNNYCIWEDYYAKMLCEELDTSQWNLSTLISTAKESCDNTWDDIDL